MTGVESITLAAAKSLAGIVIKFGWDSGSNLLQKLPDKIQQNIFNASNKYVESYEQRHGTLKVLGMQQPVKLQEIYAEVQFLGEEERQQFTSIANLEQVYRQSPARKFQLNKCQKQNGLEVANQKQYLMVLGQPGAGKSTFLRRIGLEALNGTKGKYQHECIPVFLELKQFNNENIDLEKAISEELQNCGFPDPEDSTNNLIEKLATNYLTDTRWREVFLLVAGLMRGGADQLLLLMEREAHKYTNTPKLRNLLKWIEQKTTGYKGGLKPVGKRANAIAYAITTAIALTYATNAYAYTNIARPYIRENAYSYSRAIANLYTTGNHGDLSDYTYTKLYAKHIAIANGNLNVNTIAEAINEFIEWATRLYEMKIFKAVNFADLINQLEELKNKIPSNEYPPEERRAFLGRVLQSWLITFDLTLEMINLSKEEFKTLTNYFYANYLIIQCKEAAVRLTPATWEAIEERMLFVPGD